MQNGPQLDDATIVNESHLWRRVRSDQVVCDQELNDDVPSSAAFQDIEQGGIMAMSVALADVERAAGRTVADNLAPHPAFGMVLLTAGFVRSLGMIIVRAAEPQQPGHAHVIGKKTKSIRRQMAKNAKWLQRPSKS